MDKTPFDIWLNEYRSGRIPKEEHCDKYLILSYEELRRLEEMPKDKRDREYAVYVAQRRPSVFRKVKSNEQKLTWIEDTNDGRTLPSSDSPTIQREVRPESIPDPNPSLK